jgi:pimeloyl-ACP methyl ester carboxylesterase
MPRIEAGGIELNYEEYGSGPEPLVLIHGWTGTLHNWHAVVQCGLAQGTGERG